MKDKKDKKGREKKEKKSCVQYISLLLGLAAIVLLFESFYSERLGAWEFGFLILVAAGITILFYHIENITKIVIDKGKLLVELREIKKEIYAKAETVSALTEDTVKFIVYLLTRVGRLTSSEELKKKLVEARGDIYRMLEEAFYSHDEVESLLSPLDTTILRDMGDDIYQEVSHLAQDKIEDLGTRGEIQGKLRGISKDTDIDGLRDYLRNHHLLEESIEEIMKSFEYFRKNKRLPD